ncbi:MAG: hypothetical protein AAF610_07455 [Pseudomonadota bacterium]
MSFAETTTAAPVQDKTSSGPCQTEQHRQFDFWLGTWDVYNQATPDKPPSRNVITLKHGGCTVHEEYVAGRYNGSSVNIYSSATGSWHQTWTDVVGTALFLKGGLDERGRMVLFSSGESGPLDRITWTPLDNGDVRQHWQQSKDNGATWVDVFDGLYKKAAD